jgi:hypothetical protein
MKKTLSIVVDVEDGEDVLLLGMLSTGISVSVSAKADKGTLGAIMKQFGVVNDRPVTISYEEKPDAAPKP